MLPSFHLQILLTWCTMNLRRSFCSLFPFSHFGCVHGCSVCPVGMRGGREVCTCCCDPPAVPSPPPLSVRVSPQQDTCAGPGDRWPSACVNSTFPILLLITAASACCCFSLCSVVSPDAFTHTSVHSLYQPVFLLQLAHLSRLGSVRGCECYRW